MDDRARFDEFARLATEQRNPRTADLDTLDATAIPGPIRAEDRTEEGEKAMAELGVGPKDAVIGLAASRRTPFVVAALAAARALRARTAYVTCTPRSEFTLDVDVAICPVVGPEAIMGSTRMKA